MSILSLHPKQVQLYVADAGHPAAGRVRTIVKDETDTDLSLVYLDSDGQVNSNAQRGTPSTHAGVCACVVGGMGWGGGGAGRFWLCWWWWWWCEGARGARSSACTHWGERAGWWKQLQGGTTTRLYLHLVPPLRGVCWIARFGAAGSAAQRLRCATGPTLGLAAKLSA